MRAFTAKSAKRAKHAKHAKHGERQQQGSGSARRNQSPCRGRPWRPWRFAVTFSFAALCPPRGEAAEGRVVVRPEEYTGALRNPLKGFTLRGFHEKNDWATLAHCYIRWNEIENREGDSIDKIRQWCDKKWKDVEKTNVKVIPRVYLHWSGDRKYWPADMKTDDYTSPQFKERAVRLVRRLGECWDADPRVAHVEMGIIGKWGEHHSPSPDAATQKLLGDAFTKAFRNKKVMVRHAWEFRDYSFGIYWDSWAHANQMKSHGERIAALGDRWQTQIIGGEVAYDWGRYREQPGDDPTDTVSDPAHRRHLIDTIRRLHCTQLRWVAAYDRKNPKAREGGEEIQKAFGYRFVLDEVSYPARLRSRDRMSISFKVRNTGSAPFYYGWPVEAALLDPNTRKVVWRDTFKTVDIRKWLPGDGWDGARRVYAVRPNTCLVKGEFSVRARSGVYVLALAILDPAGMLPSVRFAVRNYWKGGRHPIGLVGVGRGVRNHTLPAEAFDDPREDDSLHYHGTRPSPPRRQERQGRPRHGN